MSGGSRALKTGGNIGLIPDQAPVPETREALAAHLNDLGVQEGSYHLFGAHINDALVRDRQPEGWVVFHSERGGENLLAVHELEAAACADLLARLTSNDHVFFELVSGPTPTAAADAAFRNWLDRRGLRRADLDPADWKCDDVPWVKRTVLAALLRADHCRREAGEDVLMCRCQSRRIALMFALLLFSPA